MFACRGALTRSRRTPVRSHHGLCEGCEDEARLADGGKRDEHRPALRFVGEETCQLDGEPRLAGTTGSDDGEETGISIEHDRNRLEKLVLPAHERRRRCRKLDAAGRPERRKLSEAELMDAD